MKQIKTIFFGNPAFGLESVKWLNENTTLLGVITDPPKLLKSRKTTHTQISPIRQWALENQIPIVDYTGPEVGDQIRDLGKADLGIIIGFKILPKEIFGIPLKGCLNVHTSLLPKYRGAAPIEWAIRQGEKETGITIFRISPKVDTGNIIWQETFPIRDCDDQKYISESLQILSTVALQKVFQDSLYDLPGIPQDSSKSTPAPKITKENSRIDWLDSAFRVFKHIKGFPDTWTTTEKGEEVKILDALGSVTLKKEEEPQVLPGKIIYLSKTEMAVACKDGWVILKTLQKAGKSPINVREFINGYKNSITRFI